MRLKRKNLMAKGFTLIEVLIALVILAVALMAVIFTFERSIQNTDRLRNKIAANCVALNVIASMQVGLLAPPTDAMKSGESQCLGDSFQWTAGVDQAGNNYYERIYVDVNLLGKAERIQRLYGFVVIAK